MTFWQRMGLYSCLSAMWIRFVLVVPMDFWPGIVPSIIFMIGGVLLVGTKRGN